MLDQKIGDLKREISIFASLIEAMVAQCIRGIQSREKDLLIKVIEESEPVANEYDINIDEACIQAIAQYQPQGKSLRTILMIYKMGTDLERLGDIAVSIAKRGLFLIENAFFTLPPLFDQMVPRALEMLRDSVKAFVNEDAKLAREIVCRDAEVDRLRNEIIAILKRELESKPYSLEVVLCLIDLARKLERIADLSTNICEEVIFMVEGVIIKHHREK